MLYLVLKPLMKAALRLYFRRIVPRDLAHIDNGRATIILANHTASFMDAVITACFVKRRIHFFTRGDIFSNSGAALIMRSLGMLPIYRMMDGKEMLQRNERSNNEALKILSNGGAVLIFCEGVSDIAPLLKPLKKGPFRLAAIAKVQLKNPPVLVPLGINYVNPVEAFDDAFLVAGAALPELTSYDDVAHTATQSMRAADGALKPLVWHVADPRFHALASLCLKTLAAIKPGFSFEDSQRVVMKLKAGESDADLLLTSLDSLARFSQTTLLASFSKFSVKNQLLLVLGFPIALAGFFANFIPVSIALGITRKKVAAIDFKAPVFLSLATILSIIYLLLLLVLCTVLWSAFVAVIAVGAVIFSGWFFLKIYKTPFAHFRAWLIRKRSRDTALSTFQVLLKRFVMKAFL